MKNLKPRRGRLELPSWVGWVLGLAMVGQLLYYLLPKLYHYVLFLFKNH
jgi:hypothetical protein